MDTLIKDEQSAPVEFRYDQPASGLVAPELFVTWCVAGRIEAEILKRGIKHAHLLIIVTKDGVECSRQIKPLVDGGGFVNFDRSRVNEVRAIVVWPNGGESPEDFRGRIMKPSEEGDGYRVSLLDRPLWSEDLDRAGEVEPRPAVWKGHGGDQPVVILGLPEEGSDERYYYAIEGSDTRIPAEEVEFPFGFRTSFDSINRLTGEAVEGLDVDPELFAKPPRDRTKRFVGFFPWGRKRAADQCDMRGQITMSLLASPFVGLYWVLLRAPAGLVSWLFLTWLGIPGVTLRPVFHPVRHRFEEIWSDHEERSRWVEKADGEDTHTFLWVVNPVTVGVVLGILAVVNAFVGFFPWWAIVAVGVGGPVAVFLVGGLVFLIIAAFPFITKPFAWAWQPVADRWTLSRELSAERKREEAEQQLLRDRELLKQLACEQNPRGTKIRDVNGGVRKIIPLFATRGKTVVCKRYARG